MKEYPNIKALKREFVSGKFEFVNEFTLDGVVFAKVDESTKHTMWQMVEKGYKGVVVYAVKQNRENEQAEDKAHLTDWLIFLWGLDNKLRLVPYDVRNTTHARGTMPIKEANVDADRVIADKVEVQFINLPVTGSLVAKVDTGAEMCSLHAEDIQINQQAKTVSFNAPNLSRNRFTLPLASQQSVRTSGGDTKYRPVIKTDMKIRNKVLKDILVNLNNRDQMTEPMLLGQNALQAGKFIVDPNILQDSAEFSSLQSEVVPNIIAIDDETSKKLYDVLNEVGDITLAELLTIVRTQVINNIDDITY